jgi:fumarate reductase flavoprotein subunit
LVLEKAGKIGGTSAVTGGMMSVNPPSQVNSELTNWTDASTGEIYDKPAGQLLTDADALYNTWLEYTTVNGTQDAKEDLVRLTIDDSGETMDWLENNGFEFNDAVGFLGGKWSIYTTYTGDKALTQGFFDQLLENYTNLGGQYLLETTGSELIFTDGKVSGVNAVKKDGTKVIVNAKKVILACGGFAGSNELMDEYLGESWKVYGMMQNDGAGIRMALSAGAATYNIDMPPMSHFSAPQSIINQFDTAFDNDILYGMVNSSETLAVNKEGNRFVNEQNIGYGAYVGGARFYSIYSSDMIDIMRKQGFGKNATGRYMNHTGVGGGITADTPMTNIDAVLEAGISAGTVYKADTLEKLAQTIAQDNTLMNAETFLSSISDYNIGITSGEDAFGKSADCFDRLGSIGDGCDYYIAVIGAPYIYSTCGGIDVDASMHVLDANGVPIENLYSVGTDSMGVLFSNKKGYANYGGVAQGWCYVSGKIAGKDAAVSLK